MTNIETIKILDLHINYLQHCMKPLDENVINALIVAMDNTRKQIPVKPVQHDNCGNKCVSYRCPKCFEIVFDKPYCEECGQKLDIGGIKIGSSY